MTAIFRVGDVGSALEVFIPDDNLPNDQPLDISSASTKTITLRRPDGAKATYQAAFLTNGTDGLLVILSGPESPTVFELDQAGTWRAQGFVVLPGGQWSSEIGTFPVGANL